MTDLEQVEQELEELKDQVSGIEDLLDDAETSFKKAFTEGYESAEGWIDDGIAQLEKIKALPADAREALIEFPQSACR